MNKTRWLMVSGLLGMLLLGLSLYFNPLSIPLHMGIALTGSGPMLFGLVGGGVLLALKYIRGIFWSQEGV